MNGKKTTVDNLKGTLPLSYRRQTQLMKIAVVVSIMTLNHVTIPSHTLTDKRITICLD